MFAVVVFHRIYESVELGNASVDHLSPSKLVAPVSNTHCTNRADRRQMILYVGVVALQGLTWRDRRPHNVSDPPYSQLLRGQLDQTWHR